MANREVNIYSPTWDSWPTTWKQTRTKTTQILDQLELDTKEKPLETQQLIELNSALLHISDAWNRSWRNPLIRRGIRILRDHFSHALPGAPRHHPRAQFHKIHQDLPSEYFDNKNNAELEAFLILRTFHMTKPKTRLYLDYETTLKDLLPKHLKPT